MNVLRDWQRKTSRGKRHAKILKEEINSWKETQGEKPPFGFRLDYDAPNHAFVVRIGKVEPMPEPWGLMIGDALFNFRAALDYLAWHLVKIGSKPNPKEPERIYFPIVLDDTTWNPIVNDLIPGIRNEHRAVIETYQPYQLRKTGQDPADHPLALLAALSRKDKHRTITLLYARQREYRIRILTAKGFVIQRLDVPPANTMFLVELDAELGRIIVHPTAPQGEVKVEIEGASVVTFENGVGVTGALDYIGKVSELLFADIEPLL